MEYFEVDTAYTVVTLSNNFDICERMLGGSLASLFFSIQTWSIFNKIAIFSSFNVEFSEYVPICTVKI